MKKNFKILSYLTSTQSYHQISNGGIFCFSTTMTNHYTPAIALRQFTSDNTNKQTNKQTLTAVKIQGCFGERYFIFCLTQVSQFAREGYRKNHICLQHRPNFDKGPFNTLTVYNDLWTAKRLNFRTPFRVSGINKRTNSNGLKKSIDSAWQLSNRSVSFSLLVSKTIKHMIPLETFLAEASVFS